MRNNTYGAGGTGKEKLVSDAELHLGVLRTSSENTLLLRRSLHWRNERVALDFESSHAAPTRVKVQRPIPETTMLTRRV